MLLRTVFESTNGAAALKSPILDAVSNCLRPVWVDKGLAWIEAFDHIDLVGLHATLTDLGLADQLSRVLHIKLEAILGPPTVAPAAKPVKVKAPNKPPASVTRVPVIEKRIQLGLRLIDLRSTAKSNNAFGTLRRKNFPDLDNQEASGLMKVAKVYGNRPEIYRNASWAILFNWLAIDAGDCPASLRDRHNRRPEGPGQRRQACPRPSADRAATGERPADAGGGMTTIDAHHTIPPAQMRRVILESPFAGDVSANIEYARACVRHSLLRGEAPLASHLLYTQPGILNDDDRDERAHGINAGHAWLHLADAIAVYTDRGISADGSRHPPGRTHGKPVEMRSIEDQPA